MINRSNKVTINDFPETFSTLSAITCDQGLRTCQPGAHHQERQCSGSPTYHNGVIVSQVNDHRL